jgi:ribosome-associated toxin RatA of RatAB toxin-antitoxin module
MKRGVSVLIILGLFASSFSSLAQTPAELTLSNLDLPTVEKLLETGNFLIVRERPDGSFKEASAGTLVDAPLDVVWETIMDYDHYPEFMPQTERMQTIERVSENEVIVEQTIAVIISVIKVHLTYQLRQMAEPKKRVRFEHVNGDLAGTHGGWDLIAIEDGKRTIIFYSLFSNLMALPWPAGAILRAEPDFMTAVNVTTAMLVVKAVREECEKRAKSSLAPR